MSNSTLNTLGQSIPGGHLLGKLTQGSGRVELIPIRHVQAAVVGANPPNLNAPIGILPVANGGTGLASGTSGGIPAYTASGTIASSVALTAGTLVKGGGAGAAPGNSAISDDGSANLTVTGRDLLVTGHDSNVIVATSPAASDCALVVNCPTAGKASYFFFQDASVAKWSVGKFGDNSYAAYDNVGGIFVLQSAGNGAGLIIQGTNTNDSAATGKVGEFVSSTILIANEISLVTATAKNITSISLTAGDWEVNGNIAFDLTGGGTTIATQQVAAISTTTGTLPTIPGAGGYTQHSGTAVTAVGDVLPVGPMRLSLSTPTIVYLVASVTFTGIAGTAAGYGFLGARRTR